MLSALAIANYRSLRRLVLPLGRLTLVTGPNGSGKSSVYRALRLLAAVAQGGVVRSLAREGGLASTLWAGPEQFSAAMRRGEQPVQGTKRQGPVSLQLGFGSDAPEGFGYAIDIGLPIPRSTSVFNHDPEIKREAVWNGPFLRPASLLVERRGAALRIRGATGWEPVARPIPAFASMMTEYAEPRAAPEMLSLREQMRGWRFYDHFRSDADALARVPQLGTTTTVLSDDGSDLAAAWQTIREIGDHAALDAAVQDAFPGGRVQVEVQGERFALRMHQHGLLRPLDAAELSDGTLRYLLWIAALLTPRPPALLVLNEPETSLHPDLLPALGRLIAQAARASQVIVVTHAPRLLAALDGGMEGTQRLQLHKPLGETQLAGLEMDGIPRWEWLAR
ncbi:AAA family ATPase [Pseudorhodoferax sp. Leaf274]|uniref:AAA family ATPase n=1 Tax=Pseudorhodoferax sp. Leaf274 TaxID=1736318 RepID=UPI00070382E3|nr:AAA family ATPase [Pseudorhodoferax sp. Leaf274]KQP35508.1 ATP-binding protein [Pseudorhodoferax sp. Leaf274]